MSDKTYNVSDTASADQSSVNPSMNFTENELKDWLQEEYESRPMISTAQPGEYTRRQIQEMLGMGEDAAKKFLHELVLQGKMSMRKVGGQCYYKKVEILPIDKQ